MNNFILWLPDIMPRHQVDFGSKAANLGLIARKSRTPLGFCIGSRLYFKTMDKAGILPQIISMAEEAQNKDLDTLTQASDRIAEIVEAVVIPKNIEEAILKYYNELVGERDNVKVAVRSSATAEDLPTASFAGQLESYLNVETYQDVLKAIIKCWASLWTPRAIHYRFQKGIGQRHTGMSVIIQEMVDAKISGVMFTANPLNNSRKEVYIEAIAGLGEALVQGEINGDRYVVSKDNLFITQKEAVEQETYLTDFNIKWLANEGLKLQYLFYDDPQDIEWAFDKGEIYLLQSRPITTLGEDEPEPLNVEEMTMIQKDIWTNVNERFPEPILPIDSVIAKMFYLSLFEAYQHLGYSVPTVDWSRVEEGDFPDFFAPPAITVSTIRVFKLFKFLNEDIAESWKYNENAFNKYLGFLKDDQIRTFPMEIIIEYIEDALKDFQRANTFRYYLYIQYGTWYKILARILTLLYGETGEKIQQDLIAGHPQTTIEVNDKLVELASYAKQNKDVQGIILNNAAPDIEPKLLNVPEGKSFLLEFTDFINKYGDREVSQGLGGIGAATWRDRPDVVWGMLKGILLADESSMKSYEEILKRREVAERKLTELTSQGIAKILPVKRFLDKLLLYARKYTAFREDSHFYLTQAMPVFREMFLEIGRQLVKRDIIENENEVLYFTYWELKDLVFAIYSYKKVSKLDIAEKLSARKRRLESRRKKWLTRGVSIDVFDGDVLKGIGSSNGKISGKCKVILDPKDLYRLEPGDILVAQSTNPSWTPVFSFIGGLIVEYGSAISHAAIIAREYGIPAVMGVKGVTTILKDNDTVTIDGALGVIQLETKEKAAVK